MLQTQSTKSDIKSACYENIKNDTDIKLYPILRAGAWCAPLIVPYRPWLGTSVLSGAAHLRCPCCAPHWRKGVHVVPFGSLRLPEGAPKGSDIKHAHVACKQRLGLLEALKLEQLRRRNGMGDRA